MKLQLKKQKGEQEGSSPTRLLRQTLLTLDFFPYNEQGINPTERQRIPGTSPLVYWKTPEENIWKGPDPLITWRRGYVCVFPETMATPFWIPSRRIKKWHGGRPTDT